MLAKGRKPQKNTTFSVHFVIKGAEKRRTLAYAKARLLQNEIGLSNNLVRLQ